MYQGRNQKTLSTTIGKRGYSRYRGGMTLPRQRDIGFLLPLTPEASV